MWAFRMISICFDLPRFFAYVVHLQRILRSTFFIYHIHPLFHLVRGWCNHSEAQASQGLHIDIFIILILWTKRMVILSQYIIVQECARNLWSLNCIYRISYCNFHNYLSSLYISLGRTSLRTSAKRLRFGSHLPLVPPPLTQRLLDDLSAPWRQKSPSEKRERVICIICRYIHVCHLSFEWNLPFEWIVLVESCRCYL